jgi:DNA polymerase-3 subunit gamma/tau
MGHLSLYRKHRPQTFADVVGQAHITRTLGKAIAEGRLAHAYLFSGPRGTGKTSTARILAKCLNCDAGPTAEPCNACTSCVEITAGRSLDVVEIDAASHGSVDDARDIREKVAYSPAAGRSRVYIVDECHMLSPAANNALLKVLEEPPAHVVFVFATTEPHKVLQTLLDRCQRYEFRAIGPDDVAERVRRVAELEGISIEPDAVEMLANRAGGSMRDALSLLDQLWSYAETGITGEDLARLLGSVPEDTITEAVDIVSDQDAGAAFLFVDRLTREGRDVREFVRALTQHLRSLFLVLHAPAAQEILDVTDLALERLRSQANRFDANELLRLIDLANETNMALRQAVEGRLVLEVMLVRMARPDLHPSPAAMLARIERLERLAGVERGSPPATETGAATSPPPRAAPPAAASAEPAKPAPRARPEWRSGIGAPARQPRETGVAKEPAPPPPAAASRDGADSWAGMEAAPVTPAAQPEAPTPPAAADEGPALDLEKVRLGWDVLLEKVKKRRIAARAMLLPASPVAWRGGELVLEFDEKSRFHRDQMSDPSYQTPLSEAFHETFGVRPRIRCVLREPRNEPEQAEATPAPEDADDPETDEPGATAPVPPAAPGHGSAVDLIRQGFGAEVVDEF